MEKDKKLKIFNPKHTKEQRKYLRNNMTNSGIILWSKLKGKQILNYKFRRQHGIGDYIVDFYCPKLMLVIEEVDGDSHYTNSGKSHNLKRTSYLNNLQISILRFINLEVKGNLDGALTEIVNHIHKLE